MDFAQKENEINQLLKSVMELNIIYLGIIHGFFTIIDRSSNQITYNTLASAAALDPEYVKRWLDASVAFGLIDVHKDGLISLNERGTAYIDNGNNGFIAQILQAVYSTLISDQAVNLFQSGDRPGYSIVNNFPNLRPWYGYIFESLYLSVMKKEILTHPSVQRHISNTAGDIIDYGCGNGWLLRTFGDYYPQKSFLGLDGDPQIIDKAIQLTADNGLSKNVSFRVQDFSQPFSQPVGGVIINRSLHHFGDSRLRILKEMISNLSSDGFLMIWDFNWTNNMNELRNEGNEDLSFLQIIEHIQGNSFLELETIIKELSLLQCSTEYFFVNRNRDYVILASKQ
ncbi:trans-aconitate 2-methyltransferase [Paenibacillus sp. NFR01]|uniref:class I SAM-dependent methyltransferase n=1 Tax=Paenibacillus sp. NFR01 TaxID=1566279 RepID=UPI0008CACF47|nr:class I SAM-dependent methyltransferase [Paenibacillus sp. NFR01]SEU27845.1 Methyltransferase domain-containing protein [Paenibacillus sp. NFR01]